MELGLKAKKYLVWTTEKPYKDDPRVSTGFLLQNEIYTFYLCVNYGRCYCLRIRDKSDKDVSILPCDASVCILNESERSAYLETYTSASTKADDIWFQWDSDITTHISDFSGQRFMHFKITFHNCDTRSLHVVSETGKKSVRKSSTFNNRPCLESLSVDFSRLLDKQKYAPPDVELKCGSYSVQAHKAVLGARSEVFAAMLQSDMLEGQTGQVEVKHMDEGILQEFITYLYSGTLPELTMDKASAFYEAGDKYAVRGLMRRCANFLTENISPENACDFLVIADAHSDQEFKDVVMSYIIEQSIPLDEEHWPTFCVSHPSLANEVLNRGFKLYCPK